jgi:O-antigen/teichoic acid export membrane protein
MNGASVSNNGSNISLKRLLAIFAGGNLICLILRLGSGLLVARATTPETLGLFNGLSLVLGYVPFVQLGIINGLNRELPYYIGLNDKQKAYALASCAQVWALIVGSVTGAILIGVGVWQFSKGRNEIAFGWLIQAWLSFQYIYVQMYLLVTYRSKGDFSKLTISNVIQSIATFALIIFVWLYGFYGLCIRAVLVSLVAFYTMWKWRPLKVRAVWNYESFKHLLKIGAPIFGVSQIYAWWIVLDSTLVLRYKGIHNLGVYAVAIMAGTAIEVIPAALSQISYPRMAEEYGHTGSLSATTRIVIKPVRYLTLVYIPLVLICWYAAPPAIRMLIPKYVESVKAVQWTCASSALLALTPINSIFVVIKRLDIYFAAIMAGIGTYVLTVWILYKHDSNLSIFPKSLIVGRVVFLLICYSAIKYIGGDNRYEHPVSQ